MKNHLPLIFFLIFTACGFKVVKNNEIQNYNISEILASGEKRVNHIIRSKLLSLSKKDSINQISINFNTKIEKSIKEKNIKNEITKYNLLIIVDGVFKDLSTQKITKFTVVKNGFYNVAENNSSTRSNEKKLIILLSEALIDEISNRINQK